MSTFYDKHNFTFRLKGLRQWLWHRRLKGFLDGPYTDILDLGCGCADLTPLYRAYTEHLEGCDQSTVSLERARERGIKAFEHDIDTGRIDRGYDLIVSIGVLHHTKNGIDNLKKYEADEYIIGLYNKGIYYFLYKFLKFKNWFKGITWQDLFMSPVVHFYDEGDIPPEFKVVAKKVLWLTPITIYKLHKRRGG